MGSLYSTPAFEVFRRALQTEVIKKFRGINAYTTLAALGPEWAQDLLNVVISGSGGLSKLRLPVTLSAAVPGQNTCPNSFWDFQQGNGTRQVIAQFGPALYYYSNDLAVATLIENVAANQGQWSFVTANNIMFGVNGLRTQKWTGASWWGWGIAAPLAAPNAPGVIGGTLSPATGYTYAYAYKNSVTGHVGNRSASSTSTGAQANKGFTVLAVASADPQVDTIVWFRILDGGGDPCRLCVVNLTTGAVTTFASNANVVVTAATANLGITDNSPDSSLDQATIGPLINGLPLAGKYLAVGQGRVFIANLPGAPQDILYSGYEQILIGRPEESFPSNNRLRLSIGAEQISGIGVLQSGVVAFSQTGRMYMLRGAVEDITLNVPVAFSAYLEELPWTLGCASHFTVQVTPYGMVWLAGDKTIQLFDGRSEPIDISPGVYPLLRRITPGTEGSCVAAYFNWLERDLYVLLAAVDGSLSINRIFFFAFNKAVGSDQIETVETFISDLPATIPGAVPWVGMLTTSKLQRMLCIAAQGFIKQLPVSSDTEGGLTKDLTIIPATNGNLNAYWRSGYFGNEQPFRSKLFRWGRMISDQGSFSQTLRFVDDDVRTLLQPEIIGPIQMVGSKLGLNRRAKRLAVEINFPAKDAPANVIELQMSHIGTSDR